MAYRDYWQELTGTIPRLPAAAAMKYVNRAWSDIRDLRLWSWQTTEGDLVAPDILTTGLVDVTLGSDIVVADATAAAAFNAIALANPPLSSAVLGQGRQFRLNGGAPIYSIIAWDGATQLQLDRVYAEATGTAQTYQIYRCYYCTPTTDFIKYTSITNMKTGYTIVGRRLYRTQAYLNSIDPRRGTTGDVYDICQFRPDATGRPVHEWYPHPTLQTVYNCLYRRRYPDLSDTVDLPATFPNSLLQAKALIHASRWALSNCSTFPELAGTNWVSFIDAQTQEFKMGLSMAIKTDDELMVQTPIRQGGRMPRLPLGGSYLQSHDTSWFEGD